MLSGYAPYPYLLLVEAIMGAVWFDSEKSFEAVQNVMEHLQAY
jgi:dsRNA-specific ribonuclease